MTDIGSDNTEHQIDFLDKVLNPELISSIYENLEKVSVLIYNDIDAKPTKMVIEYYSIHDIV